MTVVNLRRFVLLWSVLLRPIPLVLWALVSSSALAQTRLVPDGRLGAEQSIVTSTLTPTGSQTLITGGALRGSNLFHSFEQFGVGVGDSVLFVGGAETTSIFSQVTGSSPSMILGTLGTLDTAANLYFINPNGIVFGPGATLQVGGSFTAATASAINFGVGGTYSAAASPVPAPLLRVDPSAYFLAPTAGTIRSVGDGTTLAVPLGASLTLLGGNLELTGAELAAPGGQVNLVATTGSVSLDPNGHPIPDSALLSGTVTLDGGSTVDVRAGGGGSITVGAATLNLEEGSQLITGIAGAGAVPVPGSLPIAGDITVVATTVRIDGTNPVTGAPSQILSAVTETATGQGGDISITAHRLEITNGGLIDASTYGRGAAGDITLTLTEEVVLAGSRVNPDPNGLVEGIPSGIFSRVKPEAVGAGGNITLTTGQLLILEGAVIDTSTLGGQGDAGDIQIQVDGLFHLEGVDALDGSASGIFSQTVGQAVGAGGDVQITAARLEMVGGAAIATNSVGTGNAGDIELTVATGLHAVDGTIATDAATNSGGQIRLTAGTVLLMGNSDIQTFVASGTGSGGNITLTADWVIAFDDSDILAFAADGQGGSITLATPVFLGENFSLASLTADSATLDGNRRVDLNATGAVNGAIALPETRLVENNIAALPTTGLPTALLVAGSCIAPSPTQGRFVVTGTGGLPPLPGQAPGASFATGTVRPPPSPVLPSEPTGTFPLTDGRLVLSRPCPAAAEGGNLGG